MPKLPYIALYTGDWLRDHVAGCSLTAQGLWLRMMILMHDSERYGYLCVNGSPIPSEQISRRCGCDSQTQYDSLLAELISNGVPSQTSEGIIYSRRMVRDARVRASGAQRQAKLRARGGGDPVDWAAIRFNILERDDFLCAYCGASATTVDHILAKSKGGDERSSNLVACCKPCNMRKGTRSMEECGMSFREGFCHASVTGNDSDNDNEISAEEVYQAYPLKVGKPAALKAIRAAMLRCDPKELLTRTACFASARGTDLAFVPHPATWFNQERYNDDPATWRSSVNGRPPAPPTKPKREIPDQMRTWLIEHYNEKREQIQQWQTMDHVPPFLRDEWFRYRKERKTE